MNLRVAGAIIDELWVEQTPQAGSLLHCELESIAAHQLDDGWNAMTSFRVMPSKPPYTYNVFLRAMAACAYRAMWVPLEVTRDHVLHMIL